MSFLAERSSAAELRRRWSSDALPAKWELGAALENGWLPPPALALGEVERISAWGETRCLERTVGAGV